VIQVAPAGLQVGHDGLHAVDGFREDGVVAFGRLELVPERATGVGLVGRKETEDPVGGRLFNRRLRVGVVAAVDRRVARVDFHEVVEEKHPEYAVDVDRAFGMFGKRQRIEADMPGMLGRVLVARAVMERGAAEDRLEPVGLREESELRCEAGLALPRAHREDSPSRRVT
jgi:hypothetical protein